MKRRLTQLAVFLLLGAIVNVAVAWGCVVADLGGDADSDSLSKNERAWLRLTSDEPDPRRDGPPVDVSDGVGWERRGLSLRDDRLAKLIAGTYADGVDWPSLEYIKAGWPLRSLVGETWLHGSQWIDPRTGVSQPGRQISALLRVERLRAPHFAQPYVLLPLRPIWRGFVANTLIYTLALWILAPYLRSLSVKTIATCRRQFHKPGHCAKCGYDLRGTFRGASGGGGVCPECGAPTT